MLLPQSAGSVEGLGPCLLSTLCSAALGPTALPTENPPPGRGAERMFRGEVPRELAEREPAGTGVQDEGSGGCQTPLQLWGCAHGDELQPPIQSRSFLRGQRAL